MLEHLQPERVFFYFEKICSIPHGSGNMDKISDFCVSFAEAHKLSYIKDAAKNVIIKKPASAGYGSSAPVILQGHLDMVCQKDDGCAIDFNTDGIDPYTDGDLIRAHGTTLGADNAIAVAMILAILESTELSHPPIEAVFTVDEEIGMLGALKLDMSLLSGRRMINLDSEEDSITVSCAGGRDLTAYIPFNRTVKRGFEVTLSLKGMLGGHSGIMINSGRANADTLMGRLLDAVMQEYPFDIVQFEGGDKANAIPNFCTARLCVDNPEAFADCVNRQFAKIKAELAKREPSIQLEVSEAATPSDIAVIEKSACTKALLTLLCLPTGVIEMSKEIPGLVETSLNLGILKTEDSRLSFCYSLRSNKQSALDFLSRRLGTFFSSQGMEFSASGDYPPWEFNSDSALCDIYSDVFFEHCAKRPSVEAIHAGLECGVFSSAIPGLDCIAVGPTIENAHTTQESLGISSVKVCYDILTDVLKRLK